MTEKVNVILPMHGGLPYDDPLVTSDEDQARQAYEAYCKKLGLSIDDPHDGESDVFWWEVKVGGQQQSCVGCQFAEGSERQSMGGRQVVCTHPKVKEHLEQAVGEDVASQLAEGEGHWVLDIAEELASCPFGE